MRDDLRRTCSDIWVIDCSPEGHQPDIPTRIFQGVQQPVCIVLAARTLHKDADKPARVRFRALPKARQREKFVALAAVSLDAGDWIDCPSGWREPFLPEHAEGWASYAPISNLFEWSTSGVTPHRMWPISPDRETLGRRWRRLKAEHNTAKAEELFRSDRDRSLKKVVTVPLGDHPLRAVSLSNRPRRRRYAGAVRIPLV